MSVFFHKPVLLNECLELLQVKPGNIYIDATVGGGGHSEAILKQGGKVIGIDRDHDAINAATERLSSFGTDFQTFQSNYADIDSVVKELGIQKISGILADLGVSSHQLDNPARGFSYMEDAPLDMRMDQKSGICAFDVINTYSEKQLTNVIRDYGEENWAARIAKFIIAARQVSKIETTFELVEIIKKAIPAEARRTGPHPAKRTFQAIRIEVNQELEKLPVALANMVNVLEEGGRLAVITFHSLEDRIVKQAFAKMQNPCTCPPKAPMCICGKIPTGKVITKRPIEAGEEELLDNPRSRSAKLRCIEKRSNLQGG